MSENPNRSASPKQRKAGFFRRRGRFIRDTVNPSVTMPDGSQRSSWSMIGGMTAGMGPTIAAAFRRVRRGLTRPPDPARFTPGFEQAEYWRIYREIGLNARKVRSIKTGLRVELGVFTAFAIYAVIQIAYGIARLGDSLVYPIAVGLGVIFMVFAVTRMTAALWRLDIHANERYQPIGVWLTRGRRQ